MKPECPDPGVCEVENLQFAIESTSDTIATMNRDKVSRSGHDRSQAEIRPLEYLERLNSEADRLHDQLQNKVTSQVGHAKSHEARADQLAQRLQKKEEDNSMLQGRIALLENEKQSLLQRQATLEAEAHEKETKLQGRITLLESEKQSLLQRQATLEAEVHEKETKLQEQNERERQLMKETAKIVKEMGRLYARLKESNDFMSSL